MKKWLWLGLAAFLAVAAFSVYQAFQSPAFVSGLVGLAAAAAFKALAPVIAKPMSAEDTKAKNHAEASGRGDEFIRKRMGSLRPDR